MSAARHIVDWFSTIDPRIWQAVIAGLFVAVGWIVNGRQNRRAATRLRREQRDDVQRALVAEIKHYLEVLEGEDLNAAWEEMRERIESGYVPFLPTEANNMVFGSVLENIHILPKSVIDPVVKYYSQLKAIELQIKDSRLHAFTYGTDKDSRDRRAAVYLDYLQMRQRARTYGIAALASMGATPGLNTQDVGRSDQ
ncbi:MAG: hypothetical protein AAFQ58_03035 [Pseudomonadota bacterium]